jgi:hypothetical protein
MVIRLAASHPQQVAAALEGLTEPLRAAMTVKLKSDAVKQEVGEGEGAAVQGCDDVGEVSM